jgi:hypothetical protein
MTELAARIENLDRAAVYEAAQLLAADLGADPDAVPSQDAILADPLAHQGELEELCRILLALELDNDPPAVAEAIDGAGHKQLVLGGAELIILGVLVLGGLQIVLSRGKTSEEVETTILERNADGKETFTTTTRKTKFGISNNTASLLRSLTEPGGQSLGKSDVDELPTPDSAAGN